MNTGFKIMVIFGWGNRSRLGWGERNDRVLPLSKPWCLFWAGDSQVPLALLKITDHQIKVEIPGPMMRLCPESRIKINLTLCA